MNFPTFGGHFSTTLPAIHQFAAKFSQDNVTNSLCPTQENSSRYTDVPTFTQHHHATHRTLASSKFPNTYINQALYGQQITLRQDKRQSFEPQEIAQEICAVAIQQQEKVLEKQLKQESHDSERRTQSSENQQQILHQNQQATEQSSINISTSTPWQSLATSSSTVADYISQLPASSLPISLHHFLKYSAENKRKESAQLNVHSSDMNVGVLQSGTVNLNNINANNVNNNPVNSSFASSLSNLTTINTAQLHSNTAIVKKKKKKTIEKEKKPKPKPGEIRLTTALDGSTLYCCPECHMAYPEKELLEQHLVGHTLERRFVCDICGAGLKRKDHLTRHKQSHNPERPYVCTVCLKAFKRKEQLTLHFVIHSGEKRHVCTECGKGFYRKDHLRKHARSHIARRVKAELSQQGVSSPILQIQVPAPTLSVSNSSDIIS